jgi:flavin-dependent dehydrogenase
MRRVETVIVGGGPAGAAAACGLAAAGREVVLVERSAGPHHKVCGEFLSSETQTLLDRLGIDPVALGAVPIEAVAVHSGKRSVTSALPFRALSLSRYRLDAALLECAKANGAKLRRGVTVRAVKHASEGWSVESGEGDTILCRNLVLAAGKWSVRGIPERRDGSLVGMKMHLRLREDARRALERRVELALLDGGYAGLELIEDGFANLCFVSPNSVVGRIGRAWPDIRAYLAASCPALAERLADADPLWERPLAVVCPTGGYLQPPGGPDVFRVGDRLAHIPPFTGDGLAIALGSAALAVAHIGQGSGPAAYLAAARRLTGQSIRLAGAVSALAASRPGRSALLGAAACAPALIGTIVRRTRLPLAAS